MCQENTKQKEYELTDIFKFIDKQKRKQANKSKIFIISNAEENT